MRYSLVAVSLTFALAACATTQPQTCRPAANAEISAELLFGMDIRGGGEVGDADFKLFAQTIIAPSFPGFTILPAAGYWHGKAEGARLVLIVGPDIAQTQEKLSAIRAAYKVRFRQKSVGLITVQSCADFSSDP